MKCLTNRNVFSPIFVIVLLLLSSTLLFRGEALSSIEEKLSVSDDTCDTCDDIENTDLHPIQQQGFLEEMALGEKDAPITIIEYASLTCSHCADFGREVLPSIYEKYIQRGKVRLIFREFASDPRAVAGFMLARCVEKNRYFPFLQVLFEKQFEWASVPNSKTFLLKISKLAGLDEKRFLSCLSDQELLEKLHDGVRYAEKFGVKATPTFFINGQKYEGAMNFEYISSILDNILEKNNKQKR